MCSLPRPAAGCVHPCERRCHPKPCKPCTIATKIACHCGLTQVYFKCNDLYQEYQDNDQLEVNREKLLSCGNRCIKNVSIFEEQNKRTARLSFYYFVKFKINLNDQTLFIYFFFSSHAVIVVRMYVIRAVVKMKNHVEKN